LRTDRRNEIIGPVLPAEIEGFAGVVIARGDDRYDGARALWNGMIDKQPATILRCTSTADVVAAIAFARDHGLPLAVRGGGHGVAGNALADDAVVVDLSPMKRIVADPEGRTARAEPGVTLGELDRATQEFGLAAPLGVVSQTGIAGLTLGGGIGWLRRKHGLAADNLVSLEVVTADGRVLTASASENADLFWGLRGGGGGLGVVTSFEYLIHPVGPDVMLLFVFYAGERTHEILGRLDEVTATTPDELSPLSFLGRVPHVEDFAEDVHGSPYIAILAPYIGSVEEGERVVAPLRELGSPIADFSGPTTYLDALAVLDADYPDGGFYYWKSADLERPDAEMIDRLTASAAAAPSDESTIDIWFHGGAMSRVAPDATAFGARPRYLIGVEANWSDPETSDANVAWARDSVAALDPFSSGGGYLNFPGLFEEGEELLRASHGAANYERLVALKQKYDPTRLFAGRAG
jgi:FAD/FMN-containing dehydrogenase